MNCACGTLANVQSNMASVRRSSLSRKQTKRLVDDLLVLDQQEHVRQGKAERDNKFYDIEIKEIDHENKKRKLHFKGYSTRHDEWRDLKETSAGNFPVVMLEKLETSSEETLGERSRKLQTTLYLKIKRKLKSVRRDDPEVRLEIPFPSKLSNTCSSITEEHVFDNLLGKLGNIVTRRGKIVHQIRDNSILSELLGKCWALRTKNGMGDIKAVRNGTLEYQLHRKPPLNNFAPIGGKFSYPN